MKKKKSKSTIETTHGNVTVSKKVIKPSVNVHNAEFKLIDNSLEELKKECRRQGVDDYSCNNIYIFLQECLKKVQKAGY